MRQLERLGISGRFQYALAKTYFYGPITGGFAGDEPLEPGERIVPAFDQTHTGTAQIFYHNRWRGFWAGSALRYGSGTIVEEGPPAPALHLRPGDGYSRLERQNRAGWTLSSTLPTSPTAFIRLRKRAKRFPSSTPPHARSAGV